MLYYHLQCVIYHWIRLNELYKLMESFSYISFFRKPKITSENQKYSNELRGVNIDQSAIYNISIDSSRHALLTNEKLFSNIWIIFEWVTFVLNNSGVRWVYASVVEEAFVLISKRSSSIYFIGELVSLCDKYFCQIRQIRTVIQTYINNTIHTYLLPRRIKQYEHKSCSSCLNFKC